MPCFQRLTGVTRGAVFSGQWHCTAIQGLKWHSRQLDVTQGSQMAFGEHCYRRFDKASSLPRNFFLRSFRHPCARKRRWSRRKLASEPGPGGRKPLRSSPAFAGRGGLCHGYAEARISARGMQDAPRALSWPTLGRRRSAIPASQGHHRQPTTLPAGAANARPFGRRLAHWRASRHRCRCGCRLKSPHRWELEWRSPLATVIAPFSSTAVLITPCRNGAGWATWACWRRPS